MAVVVNSASDVIGRTTSLPSATAFTACGWSRILGDVGNIQPIVTLVNGSVTGTTLVWRTGASSDMEIWALSSGGVSNSGTFASRPATNSDFFWYVRCSGTGAGQLQAGWLAAGGDTFVTASAQMLANTPTQFTVGTAIATYGNNSRFAAVKVWDAVLTDAELFTEAQFQVAIRRSSQRYEWPLLDSTDSRDLSGNGFSPTLTSVDTADGPPAAWAPRPQVLVFAPAAVGGGAEEADFSAATSVGATFAAIAAAQSILTAAASASSSLSGQAATLAALTAALAVGDSDAGSSAAQAALSASVTSDEQMAAVAQAASAIQAGLSAGEAWAALAAAQAGLTAGVSLDATFASETEGAQEAALQAGTEAAAQFLGAVAAFGLLSAGATASAAFAASATVLAAWTEAAQFGASFATLTGDSGDVSAAAAVAAAFAAVATSSASLSAGTGLSSAFTSIGTALAVLSAGVSMGATFLGASSADVHIVGAVASVRAIQRMTATVTAVGVKKATVH